MKIVSVLMLLMLPAAVNAQNIITNPGFENLATPPSSQGQLLLAIPWQLPSTSTATPEIYNSSFIGPAATPCDNVDVPLNAGGNAAAHGGNGYAGISIDPINGFYEYITAPLPIPLDPGEIYILDFWVLLADSSRYQLNRFGALLSSAAPVQGGSGVIPFTPQFENAQIIADSINWTHIQFPPYQAVGGEQFLTIGIFRTNGDPVFTVQDRGARNSGCSNFDNNAYYYIDDVSLIPNTVIFFIPNDSMCVCPYNYSSVLEAVSNVVVTWTNASGDSIGTGATLEIPEDTVVFDPGEVFTYYAMGNNTLDSIKVHVVNVPTIDLGPDTTFCENDSVLLNAYAPDILLYTWSTGDSLPYIYAKDTGVYSVLVDNCGCSAYDSIWFHTLLPNIPVDLGEDSLYCFFNYDSLKLNATTPDAVGYLWSPTGETTAGITVQYADSFSVLVIKENGCRSTDGFEVMEICPATYFIPNAFTPDGDGINDFYRIPVTDYVTYTLRIFDRFGRLIFKADDPSIGWDGKYEGKDAPIGVYTYKININGFKADGDKDNQKLLGTFVLYR